MKKPTREERRKFKSAAAFLDKYGCMACRKSITEGELEVLVRVGHLLKYFHKECMPAATPAYAIGISTSLKDPHSERDRIWFEQHPGRDQMARLPYNIEEINNLCKQEYLRALTRGEVPNVSASRVIEDNIIIVTQLEPGKRLRNMQPRSALHDATIDECNAFIEAGNRFINPGEEPEYIPHAIVQLMEPAELVARINNDMSMSIIEHARAQGEAKTAIKQ